MKFRGKIGFVKDEEVRPGVYKQVVTERPYRGDVVRNSRRWDTPTEVNNNLNLSNELSIVADSYILQNAFYIKYVEWMGGKWLVNFIEPSRPRIRLTLGGAYNGESQT